MNQIKRARLREGLTQGELAERLGMTYVQISRWETGKSFPSVRRLKKVAEALHTTVNDLLEEEAG